VFKKYAVTSCKDLFFMVLSINANYGGDNNKTEPTACSLEDWLKRVIRRSPKYGYG
jgi:hypothetical protein